MCLDGVGGIRRGRVSSEGMRGRRELEEVLVRIVGPLLGGGIAVALVEDVVLWRCPWLADNVVRLLVELIVRGREGSLMADGRFRPPISEGASTEL